MYEPSLLVDARRYTDYELSGHAHPKELQWLREHPYMWYTALNQIETEVVAHIAKARADLAPLRPTNGQHASPQYLEAKAAVDQKNQGRLHVLQLVRSRKIDVRALLGDGEVIPASRVVTAIGRLIELVEAGDIAEALAYGRHMMQKFHTGSTPEGVEGD